MRLTFGGGLLLGIYGTQTRVKYEPEMYYENLSFFTFHDVVDVGEVPDVRADGSDHLRLGSGRSWEGSHGARVELHHPNRFTRPIVHVVYLVEKTSHTSLQEHKNLLLHVL